jgi:hypothetical protein
MARVPCFLCCSIFEGEARNVYLSVYRGDLSAKFRHIVCPECEGRLASDYVGQALHRDVDGRWKDPEQGESLESILAASEPRQPLVRWQKVS